MQIYPHMRIPQVRAHERLPFLDTQVTVERRLYDIGSILSSANLIKKSYLGRKRCACSFTSSPEHIMPLPVLPMLYIYVCPHFATPTPTYVYVKWLGHRLIIDMVICYPAGSQRSRGCGSTMLTATPCRRNCSRRRPLHSAAHWTLWAWTKGLTRPQVTSLDKNRQDTFTLLDSVKWEEHQEFRQKRVGRKFIQMPLGLPSGSAPMSRLSGSLCRLWAAAAGAAAAAPAEGAAAAGCPAAAHPRERAAPDGGPAAVRHGAHPAAVCRGTAAAQPGRRRSRLEACAAAAAAHTTPADAAAAGEWKQFVVIEGYISVHLPAHQCEDAEKKPECFSNVRQTDLQGSGQVPQLFQPPLQHAGSFPLPQQFMLPPQPQHMPPLPPGMMHALSNPAALQACQVCIAKLNPSSCFQ